MRLVVFDVDGTLVDSQHHILSAMTGAFAAAGLEAPGLGAVRRIVGLSLPQAMAALAPRAGAATLDRLVAGYKAAFAAGTLREDAPLYPGARDCLDALAGQDALRLAVATGKSRRGLDAVLDAHGLTGRFVSLQTADHHPSKPHPAMLDAALAEAGVPADRAVMIGDTSFDMAMAGAAGVTALGVAWGYHDAAELSAAGAAGVAPDYPALHALIRAWMAPGAA